MPTSPTLAALLRPRGAFARLCSDLWRATPGAEAEAVLASSTRLLLRALFLRAAAGRGLLPGGAPAHGLTWAQLGALSEQVARGELAPGAGAPGGIFDGPAPPGADRLDDALLGAVLGQPDDGALPARLLGDVYEELAGRRLVRRGDAVTLAGGGAARGAGGVYYTPQPIVDEIIEAALARTARELVAAGESVLALRVCDPAMGSGHFLAAAAHLLAGILAEAEGDAPYTAAHLRAVAERCLFGVDLSPVAADLARLCLWLECSAPGAPLRLPVGHLRAGESLLGVAWEREFDVVIGNPPWGAAPPADRELLRRRYRSGAGETERATLFLELALQICRPGGRLGLVTPNTWLTLVRQARLRRLLLDAAQIELLSEHRAGAFSAAPSIVPLVVVLRVGGSGAGLVRRHGAERPAAQAAWRRAPGAAIDLRIGDQERRVLAQIDACSAPLGDVARVAYGVKTGGNRANLAAARLSDEYVPALTGSGEVRRHAISWRGGFLRYGPHLAGYRSAPIAVPKLVVQYIRGLSLPQRLVAAVDEAGAYYPLNNFSYITGAGPYDLFFLCALLCSSLMNRVFAARYHDYNIKPAYLRRLPVRRIAFATPPALRQALAAEARALPDEALPAFADARLAATPAQADVVHDLLANMARRVAALHQAHEGAPAAALDALIDQVVWRLYGLAETELPIAGA